MGVPASLCILHKNTKTNAWCQVEFAQLIVGVALTTTLVRMVRSLRIGMTRAMSDDMIQCLGVVKFQGDGSILRGI
jgi:hypothetical protein